MILPMVVRSGVTPKRPWALPAESLNPVMTSSKMRRAPCSFVIFLISARYPFLGVTTPTFPMTGSIMMPAMSSFLSRSDSNMPASLYSTR